MFFNYSTFQPPIRRRRSLSPSPAIPPGNGWRAAVIGRIRAMPFNCCHVRPWFGGRLSNFRGASVECMDKRYLLLRNRRGQRRLDPQRQIGDHRRQAGSWQRRHALSDRRLGAQAGALPAILLQHLYDGERLRDRRSGPIRPDHSVFPADAGRADDCFEWSGLHNCVRMRNSRVSRGWALTEFLLFSRRLLSRRR